MRFRLFEIEDQPRCPVFIRDAMTDHLRFTSALFEPYRKAVPLVSTLISSDGGCNVIDLCSGAGGPWSYLGAELARLYPKLEIVLTDRFPHRGLPGAANGATLVRYPEPVDATAIPPQLKGARTLFTSYHHFDEAKAIAILSDAVKSRSPLGVFEVTGATPLHFVMVLVVFLLCFVSAPILKPFSPWRILFTYLFPLIPLAVLWDGLVSNLRSYSVSELRALSSTCTSDFRWSAGSVRTVCGLPMRYLIGVPVGGV